MTKPQTTYSPEQAAGLWSRLYFRWVNPTLWIGVNQPLTVEDLLPLNATEDPKHCEHAFSEQLSKTWERKRPVLNALWHLHRQTFAVVFLLSLLHVTSTIASPLILRSLVLALENVSGGLSPLGLGLALGLFLSALIGSMTVHHMFHLLLKLMIRVRIGLVAEIYRKALKLTVAARQKAPAGQIINLMGTDAQKLVNALNIIHSVWMHPLQLVAVLLILYWIIGPASLAGAAVLLSFLLASAFNARRQVRARKALVQHSDERVSLINELLMSIRVVKFYAWERSFTNQVSEVRAKEVKELVRLAHIGAIGQLIFLSTPVVVAVATFATYVLAGRTLNAADVFSSLALFTVLRQAMVILPDVVASCLEANVAAERIERFLALPELLARHLCQEPIGTVDFEQVSCDWAPGVAALDAINLKFSPGEFIAVVGVVGSGKSALIASILGDISVKAGRLAVSGSLAYVSQQAWIMNDSIRNNILFGQPFDEARYRQAIATSALSQDLKQFPDGDATEIGERGVNLSGGQRQRISLARAVYSDADIVLLDDPLSALDNQVGQSVFRDCLLGALRNKTRILTTHRLEYVSAVDRVVVLDHGRLVENGSPAQLLQIKDGRLRHLWHAHKANENAPNSEPEHDEVASAYIDVKEFEREQQPVDAPARLITDEERHTGVVGWNIYKMYLAAFAPGLGLSALVALFVAKELFNVGTDSWLAYWSASPMSLNVAYFLIGYFALGIATCTMTYGRAIYVSLRGLKAGTSFHNRLLQAVMQAPMSFFEGTPVGRILNRFSRDMEAIDQQIPRSLLDALGCIFTIVSTLAVVVAVTPWAVFAVVPIAYVYYRVQRIYRPASREGQRLDSITRSPIFALFSESLAGVPLIRAYGAERRFTSELLARLETNSRSFYTIVAANRWLGTRIETLGASIVAAAAFSPVLTLAFGSVHVGFAGLSVTYALAITGAMNWAVRMFSQLESNLNSVERVEHYGALPAERWHGVDVSDDGWPRSGAIEIKNLELRYRPELPAVVRNFDCTIRPGEKIGVVGRTGAGKSSLLLGIFRLIEPTAGQIFIDNVDVTCIDLERLRSSLAIIPQEPMLFRGSVRKNLDPFALQTDERLWESLDRSCLRPMVNALPGGLDADVFDGGSNFSIGQRQLLCLARAWLKKSRVLLLDEATASVDVVTDALIQQTIRSEFVGATVLTIAHRLNTVMDYDRIMVMDAGQIVEFDSPRTLLSHSEGAFARLLREERRHGTK